jgi:hypothetical protein
MTDGILTSMHGREYGLDNARRLLSAKGFVSGYRGSQIALPSPVRQAMFNDFDGAAVALSTTVTQGVLARKGTTNTVDFTVTSAPGGTVVGTIGDTTASMAVSGVQLFGGLHFKANQGEVCFEARVKLSQITTIAAFIGFTDQVAALEMPIQSAASANTITTNATDAVGFFFDTSMTADTWWLAGVANDVDATHENTTFAPVADTYAVFRIELTAAGGAKFFYNGKQVGSLMSGAVTPTVALVPTIAAFNRTTSATPTITADYWHASALRA